MAGLSDTADLRQGGPAAEYPPTQAQPTSPTVSGRFLVTNFATLEASDALDVPWLDASGNEVRLGR